MSDDSEKDKCQCYKNLEALGTHAKEDSDEIDLGKSETIYEGAFDVPKLIRIDEKCKEYPIVSDVDLCLVFEWGNVSNRSRQGLSTAQKAEMHHDHQKATLLWIAYFFNYLKKKNPTRDQLFRHLKEILFLPKGRSGGQTTKGSLAGDIFKDYETMGSKKCELEEEDETWTSQVWTEKGLWELPLPPNFDDEFLQDEEEEEEEDLISSRPSQKNLEIDNLSTETSFSSVENSSPEKNSELNVAHMKVILDILYRIFGRFWVYLEIQSAFHNMPNVETIKLPFKLHTPKPKAPVKKPGPASVVKTGKKSVVPEKSPEEIEAERQLHKHDYILPLQESDQAKSLMLQLFGSPVSDKKGKGDKK